MANWYIRCAQEYFYPVYERMHELLLKRDIIHADETVCQVLREDRQRQALPTATSCFTLKESLRILLRKREKQSVRKKKPQSGRNSGTGFRACSL